MSIKRQFLVFSKVDIVKYICEILNRKSRKSRTRLDSKFQSKDESKESERTQVETVDIPVKTTSRTTGEALLRSDRFRKRQEAIRKLKASKAKLEDQLAQLRIYIHLNF